MPTVFRDSGIRFVIYFDDHAPAHALGSDTMPSAVLRRAVRIVEREQTRLLTAWSEIHGA